MAKIKIDRAVAGQTYFPLPIHDKSATAKVNTVSKTIASQTEQGIVLAAPVAQDDVVEITFTPVDQTGQGRAERSVPTTGQTLTPTSACGLLLVEPVGTLAALTVTFPQNPADAQQFRVFSTQTLTALTWAGGTAVNAPATLAANGSASFQYSATTNKWYRI